VSFLSNTHNKKYTSDGNAIMKINAIPASYWNLAIPYLGLAVYLTDKDNIALV
jgi:hypothetical protein